MNINLAISGWGWFSIFLVVTVVLALLLIWQTRQVEPLTVLHAEQPVEHTGGEAEGKAVQAETATRDDLTVIEGIGPKIDQLLQEAGITTFAQLAATPVEKLQQVLLDANLRIANPATWPEQAQLAAEGKWEELQKLTDSLKAGRRV